MLIFLNCVFSWRRNQGSVVQILDLVLKTEKDSALCRHLCLQGPRCSDLFVVTNGHVSAPDHPLHHGSVYRLEPRLRGGKGGAFGRS